MATGDIEWYGPEHGKGSVEDTVSHMPQVRSAIAGKTMGMARQASADLAAHRGNWSRSANPRIVVTAAPPRELDWWIHLEADTHVRSGDPESTDATAAAMGIEFGGSGFGGSRVAGLHILGRMVARNTGSYRGGSH